MAGNKNSGRRQEKPFADALRMEIAAAGEDRAILRSIARKALEKADSGDLQAMQFIADRTDGKPAQAIVGDPDNPLELAITEIRRTIVRPGS